MAKLKLEIEKNLVVSTCHITEDDNAIIQENNLAHSNEYFHLIHLSEGNEEAFSKCNLSDSFMCLYKFALKHKEGFSFLKLDRDGPELLGFPKYEW